MKIELKHNIKNDKYTEYVYEAFDIQNKEQSNVTIEANLEHLPSDWNIGVVYGGSGTGKTTILKNYFKKEMDTYSFDYEKSLISNFDWLEPKDATFLLSAMGLSSVPTWLRPFHCLSNGEQYRASLAYMVGKAKENEVILIDEYTSVVDRDVAKAMSNALQKYIRRTNKKIVLASCHFDIMEWLQPDWIYSPQKGRLEIAPCRRQSRPEIQLQIFRCRYETWNLFKQYHYLTEDLNKAAMCYLTVWNDKPVCFNAVLPFPHGNILNGYRMSRTVVLPDYQGFGIGSKITDYLASLYKSVGRTMYVKTSNPALWSHRDKSPNWKLTTEVTKDKLNSKWMEEMQKADKGGMLSYRNAITKSYKWIGYNSDHCPNIVLMKNDIYKDVAQNQLAMF